jgi:hypothetical protein
MKTLPQALIHLAKYRQFLRYVLVPSKTRIGKKDKLPISPRTGAVIDAHDPSEWVDAATALASPAGDGVAFVFTGHDDLFFIDIDGAWDGKEWSQLATTLCSVFAGAAVELSQSGTGIHIIARGVAGAHGTRNSALGLEFYTEKRFVALTGTSAQGDANSDHTQALQWLVTNYFPPGATGSVESFDLSTGPDPEWRGPTDDADLIRRALQSRSAAAAFGARASFSDLWERNVERLRAAFPDPNRLYDESAADAALIAHLAFWTGRHGERIERLMRQSALKRDKWEREDYLPRTIANVLARGGDVLKDKPPEPPSAPAAEPEAPRQRAVEGSTFMSPPEQQELFKGCVYVIDQHRVLTPGGRLLKPDQFRAAYGGYTFAMDDANQKTSRSAWEAFTESRVLRAPQADSTCFRPDLTPGCIVEQAGRKYANTWWPSNTPRKVGDASLFIKHMENLFPNERDRTIMWHYMAACVQHKGVKFQWCPVVQGPEGNGKTVLSWVVAEALGLHYTHWIDARGIGSDFNAWMDGKLLICIEELRAQDHAEEIIEKLKTYITGGAGIQIQKKGVDQYTARVVANFIANTNHKTAIRKTPDNARRFAVFFAPHQTKEELIAAGMDGEYFQRLYDWLKHHDGFAIVSELLHTYPLQDEFNPATKLQRAPDTSSTDQVIRESMGSVEQHIAEAIAQGLPGFMNGWVSTVMLERLLEERGLAGKITLNRRREMLVAMGYVPHPGLTDGRVNNPVQPDGRKPQLFVRRGSPLEFMSGAAEIAKKYSQDQQITLAKV